MIRRPPRSTRSDNTLSLHDALPISLDKVRDGQSAALAGTAQRAFVHQRGECDCPSAVDIAKTLRVGRSEEHTSELQSLMRISYAFCCLKKKTGQRPAKRGRRITT